MFNFNYCILLHFDRAWEMILWKVLFNGTIKLKFKNHYFMKNCNLLNYVFCLQDLSCLKINLNVMTITWVYSCNDQMTVIC